MSEIPDDVRDAAINIVDLSREDFLLAKVSDNESNLRNVAIDAVCSAILAERNISKRMPDDVIESLMAIGPVEWGATHSQEDEKHVEDLRDTLRLTREHFNIDAENTAIHGVYLAGTGTVLAHTGNSPNSPQHARIIAGIWNHLVELAESTRRVEQ